MRIAKALKATLGAVWRQLFSSSKVASEQKVDTQEIRFTANFYTRAKAWRLKESDAIDVYHHGYVVKENMMVRKYNGYEVGIYYFQNKRTAQVFISSIWKRDRY